MHAGTRIAERSSRVANCGPGQRCVTRAEPQDHVVNCPPLLICIRGRPFRNSSNVADWIAALQQHRPAARVPSLFINETFCIRLRAPILDAGRRIGLPWSQRVVCRWLFSVTMRRPESRPRNLHAMIFMPSKTPPISLEKHMATCAAC